MHQRPNDNKNAALKRDSAKEGGATKRVHFRGEASQNPHDGSMESSRRYTNHNSAKPKPGTGPGLLGMLCGVLIAIIFGAAFSRFVRSSRTIPSDEISPAVKSYIDRAIARVMRDPVGRRDFALYANGGRVISDLTWVVSDSGQGTTLDVTSSSAADLAVTDDLRIGQCWSLPTSRAQLGLRLSHLMHPTHVSIDHIPAEIAADIGQAPRAMVLWGAVDGSSNEAYVQNATAKLHIPALRGRSQPLVTCDFTYIPLVAFEYDIRDSSHVQTFRVEQEFVDAGLYTGVVVLDVLSNWGGSSTCLYRVRIHGEPRSDLV